MMARKLAELLPEKIREHAKAIVSMLYTALSMYAVAAADGVTLTEWGYLAVVALAAGGFVDMVPNRLTLDQVNRFFDQNEDKHLGRFEYVEAYETVVDRADFETPGEREARERMEPREKRPPDGSGKHRQE